MRPVNVMAGLLVLVILLLTSVDAIEQCQEEGAVRVETNGRVEYCRGGNWGAICLDSATSPWNEKNAQVVCKQLGFSGTLNSVLPNEALAPPEGTPYYLSSVQCNGHETALDQCSFSNISQCSSNSAAGVACRPVGTGYPFDVRLVGSPMNGRGAVEIYATVTSWFSVCPDSNVWTEDLANAVCVQLGYESGASMTFILADSSIAPRRVIKENCTGVHTLPECFTEAGLLTPMASCSAASNMFAGVECTSSTLAAGSVRLFGTSGVDDTEGRVEVLYNGKWGTVCRDGFWGRRSGETVCRQLGFSIESVNQVDRSPSGSYAGPSNNRPIWLGQLQCSATDTMLGSCPRGDPVIGYITSCSSVSRTSVDAAVNCNSTSTDPPNSGFALTQNIIYVSFIAVLSMFAITLNFN